MTDRELWQALGYRVEKRSLGICGEGYVLLLPDGGYGPGCGEGRGWGAEYAAWAQLPSADTWEGMGLVLEAMEAKGYTWRSEKRKAADYWCEWQSWGELPRVCVSAHADTVPRAVRLACLRALGVSGE